MLRDIRRATRALRREPLFTATTLLTLALGIGATTVAYTLVHTVLLSPLAYRTPNRLVFIQQVVPEIAHQYPMVGVNARSFLRWQESCRASCDGIAAFASDAATLTGAGEPKGLVGARVSPSLFGPLGVRPKHGRAFIDAEAVPGLAIGAGGVRPALRTQPQLSLVVRPRADVQTATVMVRMRGPVNALEHAASCVRTATSCSPAGMAAKDVTPLVASRTPPARALRRPG